MEKKIHSILGYSLIVLSFITPLIFSFSPLVSFSFAKEAPFFIFVFLGIFLLILQSFNQGKIVVPTHRFFIASLVVCAVYFLSALFSINQTTSLIGMGTEIETASFIIALFIFSFLISFFVRTKDKVFLTYIALGASFLFIAVFHTLRFFFGVNFLSFGIFTNIISNTLGRWSDLALFAGITTILSLTSLEFLKLNKLFKIAVYTILTFSLFILAATNFPIFIWGSGVSDSIGLFTIIGIFSLLFFVYFVSSSYEKKDTAEKTFARRVPIASLIVLVISVVFTLGFLPLQNVFYTYFKVTPVSEARLLWKPTADLSLGTLKSFPARTLFGYGPNEFTYKWRLDKPVDINNTSIWNIDFADGVGFIPSTMVTVGLLGFIAWMGFFFFLLILGLRALFMKIKDPLSHYLTVSSFLVTLFLWITQIIYTPSIVSFIFTFLFTGLFIGSLFREGIIKEKEYVFDDSKAKSSVSIIFLIGVLIISMFWAYKIGEKMIASIYANKATLALSTATNIDDVEKAKVYLAEAATLDSQDSYFRTLANISLAEINTYLQDNTTPVDTLQAKFKDAFTQAFNFGTLAVSANNHNFDNYITLGNVLESVVALNVPQSYDNAKNAYLGAQKLNPKSPLVPYLLARLEVANKNPDNAKQYIGQALSLKPQYLDAAVLLGKIQYGEGDIKDALISFTFAQNIDPTNKDIQATINALNNTTPTTVSTSTKSIQKKK